MTKDTYAGTLANPLSQNCYAYTTNNPINMWDPSGHTPIWNQDLPDYAIGWHDFELTEPTTTGHISVNWYLKATNLGAKRNMREASREDLGYAYKVNYSWIQEINYIYKKFVYRHFDDGLPEDPMFEPKLEEYTKDKTMYGYEYLFADDLNVRHQKMLKNAYGFGPGQLIIDWNKSFDKPDAFKELHVPGQKPHVHFKDGTSLNNDGTVHDAHRGTPNPSNKVIKWLEKNGWKVGD